MAQVIDFLDRKKASVYNPSEPFDKNTPITLEYDEVMVSAINFISEYMGHYDVCFEDRLKLAFVFGVEIAHHLLDYGEFRITNDFEWYYDQAINHGVRFSEERYFKDPSIFNRLATTFPERNYTKETIVEDVMNNYIDSFLKFFNFKEGIVNFDPSHEVVLKSAFERGNSDLVGIINTCLNSPKSEMTFTGIGRRRNDWNVAFFPYVDSCGVLK